MPSFTRRRAKALEIAVIPQTPVAPPLNLRRDRWMVPIHNQTEIVNPAALDLAVDQAAEADPSTAQRAIAELIKAALKTGRDEVQRRFEVHHDGAQVLS